ncbi:bifunctional diaminohydroxyphosphoribosylaminopyrimidine deaminase/5-amino-6-(5-phosphoribosylamino)uracil reductase RibD [Ignatzschineria sp. LJL83]
MSKENSTKTEDQQFLLEAIELAKQGYGRVSPNPYVGALLVKNGIVIGRGFHQASGCAHAEVMAIEDAKANGHDLQGATLYVTLEPCCFHGKTPACTDLILNSGIQKVITAMEDPNPNVAGKGHEILRNAGIIVETNLLTFEASELSRHFILNQTLKRPFVTLKAALSLDGKIATKTKDSKWITGSEARKKGHFYRGLHDAILVGKGTLLEDDPALTVRYEFEAQAPARILLLNNFTGITEEIVKRYQFFDTNLAPSIICFDENFSPSEALEALILEKGITLAPLPKSTPECLLAYCMNAGIMSLFIEGGAGIYSAFMQADLVDEFLLFYGPKLIGSSEALEIWGNSTVENLQDAPQVKIQSVELCGESFLTVATRER